MELCAEKCEQKYLSEIYCIFSSFLPKEKNTTVKMSDYGCGSKNRRFLRRSTDLKTGI